MKFAMKTESGFTLIELLIAVALGIVVVGATLGIFISNRQTFIVAENLGRVQENARTAYELMNRDVREAGGTPCTKTPLVSNVLTNIAPWWSNWNNPVLGYENGALAGSAAGTDAIEMKSGSAAVYTTTSPVSATQLTITPATTDIATGDILMVCDYTQTAIFSVTVSSSTLLTVAAAGNIGTGLGFKNPRTGLIAYAYPASSLVTKLNATRWFIAPSSNLAPPNADGLSLYRTVLRGSALQTEEVAEGVIDMQITYLLPGGSSYVDASVVTAGQWPDVMSARIVLTLRGNDLAGTNGQRIIKTLDSKVALRNRNS